MPCPHVQVSVCPTPLHLHHSRTVCQLQSDFLLSRYSAIIVDEAHERTVNTGLLLSSFIFPLSSPGTISVLPWFPLPPSPNDLLLLASGSCDPSAPDQRLWSGFAPWSAPPHDCHRWRCLIATIVQSLVLVLPSFLRYPSWPSLASCRPTLCVAAAACTPRSLYPAKFNRCCGCARIAWPTQAARHERHTTYGGFFSKQGSFPIRGAARQGTWQAIPGQSGQGGRRWERKEGRGPQGVVRGGDTV